MREGHGAPVQGKKGMLKNLSASFQGPDPYVRHKRLEPRQKYITDSGHPIAPKKMDQKKNEDG